MSRVRVDYDSIGYSGNIEVGKFTAVEGAANTITLSSAPKEITFSCYHQYYGSVCLIRYDVINNHFYFTYKDDVELSADSMFSSYISVSGTTLSYTPHDADYRGLTIYTAYS